MKDYETADFSFEKAYIAIGGIKIVIFILKSWEEMIR